MIAFSKSKTLILITSLGVSLLISELLLRAFFASPTRELSKKLYYFWTRPGFILDESSGAVIFPPNSEVRKVAATREAIEFDTSFQTNNLGLIDDIDYPRFDKESSTQLLILGDSYTEGLGANPWIPSLRKRLQTQIKTLEVYNGGIAATGIIHFNKLLNYLFNKELPISKILVIAICGDFERPDWYPLSSEEGLRLCKTGVASDTCLSSEIRAHSIKLNETQSSILKKATALDQKRAAFYRQNQPGKAIQRSEFRAFLSKFVNSLEVLKLVNALRYKIQNTFFSSSPLNQYRKASLEAFSALSKHFEAGDKYFFHLPSRNEAEGEALGCELKDKAETYKWYYVDLLSECSIKRSWYHENDHHFTKEGYKKLEDCVYHKLIAKLEEIDKTNIQE